MVASTIPKNPIYHIRGKGETQARKGSISKSVIILIWSGKLKRKSSGGERAWFLVEESEPRN